MLGGPGIQKGRGASGQEHGNVLWKDPLQFGNPALLVTLTQKGVPLPLPQARDWRFHLKRCVFLTRLQGNVSAPLLWSRRGKWHTQWSPAKGNSSFELQRDPQQEKHSHWGEQNILYCSFEMVPTQFPQSHASNSFSILTFPHYCVSREKPPTFQHPGISFPEIPKIQLGSPLK